MSRPSASAARARAERARRGDPNSLRVAPPPRESPAFDAIEAKLRPPALRKGTVSRTSLVNQLRAERSLRLATVTAPPGCGKTTTLTQWASRDERPFAWLSADERDNDPLTLLRHLAAAVDRIEPLGTLVTTGIAVPGPSIWSVAVPRLMAAVASTSRPFVVVVDDAHLLRRGDSADVVLALADAMPRGSMLVLAGRVNPPLPVARLRAAGRLLELGPEHLALSRREAQLLLRQAGVDPDGEAVAALLARAEGWPAGLFLAARALTEAGGDVDAALLHGDDRFLAEYFRAELLDLLPAERRAFMRRTSVLEAMSGSLCDAVLARRHAGRELDAIARSNVYLVALDRHGGWCRYHHLLRDELRPVVRDGMTATGSAGPNAVRRTPRKLGTAGELRAEKRLQS